MDNKYYLTWDRYYSHIKKLAQEIKKSGIKYDCIYGIPRGGLVTAVCLSHLLNIPITLKREEIFALSLKISYMQENSVRVYHPDKRILIVDDIADSGNTLKRYSNFFDIATIYKKETSIVIPTYYVKINKAWIVFPYECMDVKDSISVVTCKQ